MQNLPPENLLQHIWQSKYLLHLPLKTTDGESIGIIKPGHLNLAQGPDFFEARIKINQTVWAGNLEIHVKSSDWRKHKHQNDPAYQNIVLHVVFVHDETVFDAAGNALTTLELKPLIPEDLLIRYEQLMNSKTIIPCQNQFKLPEQELVSILVERLIIERLTVKYVQMMELLEKSNLHWEALAIQMLFRYAGMGLNNFAMEQLVSNIPFGVIQKYRSNYPSLLALFAGVSGLNFEAFDTANSQIFDSLKRLHQLPVLEKEIWKKKGTRPASFPEKRITQMVQLLHKEPQFLSKIIALNSLKQLQELLSSQSNSFSDTLLINVVIPLKFAYGKFEGKAQQEEIALSLLEEIKAEQNNYIKFYKSLGIPIENAKHSQAFLHLKKYYCSQKKCLSCLFSSHIFKKQSLLVLLAFLSFSV